MATIQVRVPDKDKKAAEKVLASRGLDLTTAVRVYLKQIILEDGIPFSLRRNLTVNGFTPEFEAEALEAMKHPEDFSPAFDTTEEAIAWLHSQSPSGKKK